MKKLSGDDKYLYLLILSGSAFLKAFTTNPGPSTALGAGGLPSGAVPSFLGGPNLGMFTPDGVAGLATLRRMVPADVPGLPASILISGILSQARGGLGVDATAIAANQGYFGPASGGAAAAAFRGMVNADLPAEIQAFANSLVTNGFLVKTGAGTYTARTLTGNTEIVIANGSGGAGNPSFTLGPTLTNHQMAYTGAATFPFRLYTGGATAALEIDRLLGSGVQNYHTYISSGGSVIFTYGCTTTNGATYTKEDVAGSYASVLRFGGAGLTEQIVFIKDSVSSVFSTTTAERILKFKTDKPGWYVVTDTSGPVTAQASIPLLKGVGIGVVVSIRIQYPIAFDVTPTSQTYTDILSAGFNIAGISFTNKDQFGCTMNVTTTAADASLQGTVAVKP